MKLKPYKEILNMSKEKMNCMLSPVRTRKAKKQAELEMCKMDENIATQEAAILELCSNKDIDFNKVLDAQDGLALMERRRKQLQKIIDELFPE